MDIPEAYLNHFDTFITDPTPTTKPLLLFTTRGLEMLEKAPGKTGYISLYPSHMASNTEFQSELSKMNILITDLIPFFNQYEVINQTLAEKDVELLKKYDGWGKTISFYEYFMRIQTERGVNVPHLNLSAADIMGKATKGILEKPSNDPVLAKSDTPDFIKEYAGTLEKEVIEADSSKEALTGERPYFRHFVIEIKCTFDEANSLEWVKNKVTSFIDHFDIQTIKSTEHLFSPQGITLLYIISSSHLAVHTWPENNYMHIDFLTCAYNKNFENLDPLVQKVFPGLESKAYELKY
jgi:S-adenosylmethionine decarboxylase